MLELSASTWLAILGFFLTLVALGACLGRTIGDGWVHFSSGHVYEVKPWWGIDWVDD